jgi:7,8-dihydropterin-6-yl-methyl-4-(beta-D-ribofuranosyl)aminobenzene 5'-phosphate synthase
MATRVNLASVDAADVTILVDNFSDMLLPSTEMARRPALAWDHFEREQLRAEHGYALLLTVEREGRRASVLYDAGLGRDTVLHNMDVLAVAIGELRAIVLSHGHPDHHGGLEGVVRRVGRRGLPLLLHPDVWRDRKVVFPTGSELHLPPPSHNDLDREGVAIVEERGPSLLLDGAVLITGQVERETEFEKGFPPQRARTEHGDWEPDTWVWDDQAIVVHVAGRGLVVLSSCGHAGIINILRHARRLTGIDRVHAFVGGMHLTGAVMEPVIAPTLAALAEISPDVVVPGHCSGFKATHELARQRPDAFIQSSVGTRLHFG